MIKMLRHIDIDEVQNGWIVDLYAEYPSDKKFDKKVFCPLWVDVEKLLRKWLAEVEKQ